MQRLALDFLLTAAFGACAALAVGVFVSGLVG